MLRITILFSLCVFLFACSPTTYYVVRHAEKEAQGANMSSDVSLSEAGKERAKALEGRLHNKNIKHIFSTNTIRTRSTAQPISELKGINIQTYEPRDTAFITKVKSLSKGDVLIVGHSNTVDDLVNQLYPQAQLKDLSDSQYGDLFIIKKKGKKMEYHVDHFGK